MEPIKVFEYGKLFLDEKFKQEHLEALEQYNESFGGKFFKFGYRNVQFKQYVGVIQVGNLTIEILPKVGKESQSDTSSDKWQKFLLDMLQECNWMRVYKNGKANLRYKYNSILEAYLEIFLTECEQLLRLGLVKKYRQNEGNVTSLKGKLLFSENIKHNSVHQERFYTRHPVYDRNNIYNQILFQALGMIPLVSTSPLLADKVYKLLFSFPETDEIKVTSGTFQKLIFDRKTAAYEEAISIAAMILLNFRPDIQAGRNNVLAILFNMNDLWEEYVFRQILKQKDAQVSVRRQISKEVWEKTNVSETKTVRPDIVIKHKGNTWIVDTKWKLPDSDTPSDNDLKQMFMYNEYWEDSNSVLLYPQQTGPCIFKDGFFKAGGRVNLPSGQRHKCGLMKASTLNESGMVLNPDMGKSILSKLNIPTR